MNGPMPDISTIFIGEKPADRKKIRLPWFLNLKN